MTSIFDISDRMLSPPSSPVTSSCDSGDRNHPMSNMPALEKLALELSMLDIGHHNGDSMTHSSAGGSSSNGDLSSLMNMQQQQHSPDGIVAGSTMNAFTSMLGFNGPAGMHFDERSKKSQNMTECVPVPSSEHVAEIVGRQGKKFLKSSVDWIFFYLHRQKLGSSQIQVRYHRLWESSSTWDCGFRTS